MSTFSNAPDSDTRGKEGFCFSYCCGDYQSLLCFDEDLCCEVVDNFAKFLMGCGFAPQNVTACMTEVAERLESAWDLKPVVISQPD